MPKIEISGVHLEITEAIREYATKKIEKIYKLFSQITHVHVVLAVDHKHPKQYKKASAHVNLSQGDLFAESESNDLYAAIDFLSDKLMTLVKKHKDKLKNRDSHGLELRDLDESGQMTGTNDLPK